MKKSVITKAVNLLVEEVLHDIGEDNFCSIDPDTIDVSIQQTCDEIESSIYEQVFDKINGELNSQGLAAVNKWWEG